MVKDDVRISDALPKFSGLGESGKPLVPLEEQAKFQSMPRPNDASVAEVFGFPSGNFLVNGSGQEGEDAQIAKARVMRQGDRGEEIDQYASAIGELFKGDISPQDAGEAFVDFMSENGDAIYAAAEKARPDDPLGYIAEQLNKALMDTSYSAEKDGRAFEIAIDVTHDGETITIASVSVGPNLKDLLEIPQN